MLDYFFKIFSNLQFLWVIYSFPVMFIYESSNIWNKFWVFFSFHQNLMQLSAHIESIYHLYICIYFCFLVFYPIGRLYISHLFRINPVAFVMQQLNQIKHKIALFPWWFYTNLVFWKKWFVCVIISLYFYFMTFRMPYLLFVNVLEEIKLTAIVN